MSSSISDNAAKSIHGDKAIDSLRTMLSFCQTQGFIQKYVETYRVGKEGYQDKQFYALFAIFFSDGTKWLIYSTTSMKTDRVKGQQWDAYNIKAIDDTVAKCFLTFPDSVSDKVRKEFERQNNKYISHTEFSAIDEVISHEVLNAYIEQYATKSMSVGVKTDKQGRTFEKRLAAILSSKYNLAKWQTNDPLEVGWYYSIFSQVVNMLNLDPAHTTSITATTDIKIIGKLPSGGNPKTDVLVTVIADGQTKRYTISCKKSSEKAVSVHQFTADAFIATLSPNDELCELIRQFQAHPTLSEFGTDNISSLTRALAPHLKELSLWALGGIGGAGNPDTQWAQYIITYDANANTTNIHTVEDYYQKLLDADISGHFGSVFQWTYPSKNRGKYIQFKAHML